MSATATILWAEDDENDVLLIQHALQKAKLGHRLLRVPDGQAAINYLAGNPPHDDRARFPLPDLLLLDLKMPRLGGFEVLAWKGSQPGLQNLPAIVLSSSSHDADVERARSLGAVDYLVKPCAPEELVELLLKLDSEWLKTTL